MIRQGNGAGNYTEFELYDQVWKKILNLSCFASTCPRKRNRREKSDKTGKLKLSF